MTSVLGWLSSLVLLATVLSQVKKQAETAGSAGVSSVLYVGQATASLGFVFYSVLVGDTVFVVTNSMLLMAALVGWWLQRRGRSRPVAKRSSVPWRTRQAAPAPEQLALAGTGLEPRGDHLEPGGRGHTSC